MQTSVLALHIEIIQFFTSTRFGEHNFCGQPHFNQNISRIVTDMMLQNLLQLYKITILKIKVRFACRDNADDPSSNPAEVSNNIA